MNWLAKGEAKLPMSGIPLAKTNNSDYANPPLKPFSDIQSTLR